MKTLLRWLAVLMVLMTLLPEGVSAQSPNPPKPSGEIAPVQQPVEVIDETVFGELPKGGSPMGPPWTVQRIDDRHFFSQAGAAKHNLKIDSLGTPHIVYGGDHLYHAWWDSIWYTEVVDSAFNVGSYASLAIDPNNFLHIAYYDADNGDLKYAHNKFGYWYIVTVVSEGDVGAGTDISVDGVGDPVFVYMDSTNHKLMAVWLQDGNMYDPPEIISGSILPAGTFAMAKFGFGVDVVFNSIGSGQGTLYYTSTRTSTRFLPKVVDYGDTHTGKVADIKIDSTGKPHVVYSYSNEYENLWTRYFISADYGDTWDWPFGTNYSSVVIGVLPSGLALALTSTNQPIVAVQSGTSLSKFTWNTNTSEWDGVPVDTAGSTGFSPAIALYPPSSTNANNPAFAYLDDPAGKNIHLNYREIWGTSWWPADGPALVDLSEKVGACSTSLTGPDGNPWVVYSGEPTQKLYFKRFYNGSWTTPQEIGSEYTGTINCYHAAAAGGGKAAVLFTTEDANLLYSTITCTGATCVISSSEVIQTQLAYPQNFIDLVLDGNGLPHMVYLIGSSSPKQLIYLYFDNATSDWVAKFGPMIDQPSASYRPVSIKRTAGGVLHVAYQKYALYDSLYYVNYTRGVWSSPERLGQDADQEEIYQGISVSLNTSGDPGVAYIDGYGTYQINLKQRSCSILPCTWPASPFAVDSGGDAFLFPSLVTDTSDHYRLCYVQAFNSNHYLQYVRINGTQKEFRPIYNYPGLGTMSSLALSSTGVGRISFNDATNGDLMFAWQNVELFLPMVKR